MKTGYDVIIRPIITENSMDMAEQKKYAFKVAKDANKTEVRKAIEEIFGVDVAKVNVVNVNGKNTEHPDCEICALYCIYDRH